MHPRVAASLCCSIGFNVFDCAENLAFDIGNNNFQCKIDNLSRNSEVDYLFSEPVWVDLEASFRAVHLLLFFSELFDHELEDVQIWHQYRCKWNVDKCCQKNR